MSGRHYLPMEGQVNPQTQEENDPPSLGRSAVKAARQNSREQPYRLVVTETDSPKKSLRESASQHVNKFVEVMSKPLAELALGGTLTNRKILAARAKDIDPAASLDNIRKLLVGPTRDLHDAMFEEMVTILEETDREIQRNFRSLEARWANMSVVTDNLIVESQTIRQHSDKLSNYMKVELEKAEAFHESRLSEMFMVIDSKLEKTTGQIARQIEDLAKKIQADMSEMNANTDRKIESLTTTITAASEKSAANLETRLNRLEKSQGIDVDKLDTTLPSSSSTNLSDRLRALRAADGVARR
jgi:polyhydroxyalkanoate synthesis regulator phasin